MSLRQEVRGLPLSCSQIIVESIFKLSIVHLRLQSIKLSISFLSGPSDMTYSLKGTNFRLNMMKYVLTFNTNFLSKLSILNNTDKIYSTLYVAVLLLFYFLLNLK